ncbi:hypothetical protein DPSP01_013139 [Paraphaeosphaeria sporulosa]
MNNNDQPQQRVSLLITNNFSIHADHHQTVVPQPLPPNAHSALATLQQTLHWSCQIVLNELAARQNDIATAKHERAIVLHQRNGLIEQVNTSTDVSAMEELKSELYSTQAHAQELEEEMDALIIENQQLKEKLGTLSDEHVTHQEERQGKGSSRRRSRRVNV